MNEIDFAAVFVIAVIVIIAFFVGYIVGLADGKR
jgi:hypothetical protein